jgi:hypothetical protein
LKESHSAATVFAYPESLLCWVRKRDFDGNSAALVAFVDARS